MTIREWVPATRNFIIFDPNNINFTYHSSTTFKQTEIPPIKRNFYINEEEDATPRIHQEALSIVSELKIKKPCVLRLYKITTETNLLNLGYNAILEFKVYEAKRRIDERYFSQPKPELDEGGEWFA